MACLRRNKYQQNTPAICEDSPVVNIQRSCYVFAVIPSQYHSRRVSNNDHTTLRHNLPRSSKLLITYVKYLRDQFKPSYSHFLKQQGVHDNQMPQVAFQYILSHQTKAFSQTKKASAACQYLQTTLLHVQCHLSLAQALEQAGELEDAATTALTMNDLYSNGVDRSAVFEHHITLSKMSHGKDNMWGARSNLVAATKIMYHLKKKINLAQILYLFLPVCKEQLNFVMNIHIHLFKENSVRSPLCQRGLEKAHLAVIHGTLNGPRGMHRLH